MARVVERMDSAGLFDLLQQKHEVCELCNRRSSGKKQDNKPGVLKFLFFAILRTFFTFSIVCNFPFNSIP